MTFINPLEITVHNSQVEIKIQGQSTGLVLDIRPPSDEAVKAVDKKHRRENIQFQREGEDSGDKIIDSIDSRLDDKVVAHVAGWTWKPGVAESLSKMKYTEKNLREFLAAVPFGDAIRDQVFAQVRKENNFFEVPAAN